MEKQRDLSIDLIKFLAVFLIINSHSDICYPRFGFLATGGSIGDALFLFCSGYTLFYKPVIRFDNWYKRRISRIYPSVFACVAVALILGFEDVYQLSLTDALGGEFILAIMTYYIILYFCRRYFSNHLSLVLIANVIVTLIAYIFFPYKNETGESGIYGITTLFRWIPFFSMMLIGAWVGLKRKNGTLSDKVRPLDAVLLLGCVIIFYGIQFAAKINTVFGPWQILTVPFLAGIVYYLWKCSYAGFLKKIYYSKAGNYIIMTIGGLCLESYLIQIYLFTDKYNSIFPLNLILITAAILIMSYVCRCLGRLMLQTFRTEPYDWRAIFSLPR